MPSSSEQDKPPRFGKLAVAPAYRVVFETIEREIIAGRLAPGTRLPSETALAEQFGVNRSTAREGLRLLEQTGLVERRAGRRLHAAVPRNDDLAARAGRALCLGQVTMGELWRLLMTLEPAAASLTAESAAEGAIDGAQIAALEDNLARTRDAVERGSGVAELDKEFHGIIAKATGNRALMLAREPAVGLLFPAVETLMPRLPQAGLRLIAAHTRILEALKAGNAPEAETWMRKHIADFKRGYDLLQLDLDAPVRPDGAL